MMNKKWTRYILGGIGACIAGAALMLTATMVVYPAISSLSGLAVAQSGILWNNVRDAAVGDNVENGVMMTSLEMWDGTNFDRLRGTIANGILVDVTRVTGNITPADGFANPTTFLGTFALAGIFNGTTWDRWRGQVAPVQIGTLLNSQNSSAANTALTLTLTGVAGRRIHLYQISAGCTGGASTTFTVADGATVIDSGTVPANNMLVSQTWPVGLTASTGANMVLVVNACGAGNVGLLNVQADQF